MNISVRQSTILLLIVLMTACSREEQSIVVPTPVVSTQALPTSTPSVEPTSIIEHVGIRPVHRMMTARAAHTATLLSDGQVLITGGMTGQNETYLASAELYDTNNATFIATSTMMTKRSAHTATLLPSGKVLLAGGFDGDYLASAELYDPKTGLFTATGSLNTARSDHVAVLLQDGKVLIAGGVGTGWTFLADAELYDPVTGRFTPTGSMTTARESHIGTLLQDGRVLITGGHKDRRSAITIYASAEIYDPLTGTFAATGDMTIKRHKHDAVLLPDGRVLVTGGSDERDAQGAYASAEIYDPATGAIAATGSMPAPRYKHSGTSVVLGSGKVLIAGGSRNAVLYDPQMGQFDEVAGSLGTSQLARLFARATLLPSGAVLITGGYSVGKSTNAGAWLYGS